MPAFTGAALPWLILGMSLRMWHWVVGNGNPMRLNSLPRCMSVLGALRLLADLVAIGMLLADDFPTSQPCAMELEYLLSVLGIVLLQLACIILSLAQSRCFAELGRQFSGDILVGRQMALDDNLVWGYITHEEAGELRPQIQRSTEFFLFLKRAAAFTLFDAAISSFLLVSCTWQLWILAGTQATGAVFGNLLATLPSLVLVATLEVARRKGILADRFLVGAWRERWCLRAHGVHKPTSSSLPTAELTKEEWMMNTWATAWGGSSWSDSQRWRDCVTGEEP